MPVHPRSNPLNLAEKNMYEGEREPLKAEKSNVFQFANTSQSQPLTN